MALRVLLTGAGGFVGHHTLEHFLKNTNWEIVVIDSFRHYGLSARIREIFEIDNGFRSRVQVITHDLRAPIDKVTASEIGDVDVIVNMASESHVDRSIDAPRIFIENNTCLVLTMLDFARTVSNLRLFIQISTDEVYGAAPQGYSHHEYDVTLPSNPYAASKASQEAISIAYWRTYDLPVVISNTMNIVGERQDPEKFFPKIITKTLQGSSIEVHAKFQDSQWHAGSRYYLHARNQADALKFIIERFSQNSSRFSQGLARPLRFHVVGEKELKNDELVRIIQSIIGKTTLIKYVDFHSARPGHDLRYALEPGSLKELGWMPPVPLEKSIEKSIEWYLKNPKWLQTNLI